MSQNSIDSSGARDETSFLSDGSTGFDSAICCLFVVRITILDGKCLRSNCESSSEKKKTVAVARYIFRVV